jgi:NO-binding membrane sensor protein with MHYT domain
MHFVEMLGQHMAARDFDRQVPDLKVSVAVLNGVTALGIPVMEAVG